MSARTAPKLPSALALPFLGSGATMRGEDPTSDGRGYGNIGAATDGSAGACVLCH